MMIQNIDDVWRLRMRTGEQNMTAPGIEQSRSGCGMVCARVAEGVQLFGIWCQYGDAGDDT